MEILSENMPETERTADYLQALAGAIKIFIHTLAISLPLFATLPVKMATPEHTFSAMKILKTYLCSRLTDEQYAGIGYGLHSQR